MDLLQAESEITTPVYIVPSITITDGVAEIEVEVFTKEVLDNVILQILIIQDMVSFSTPQGVFQNPNFPDVAR